jgi:hypothetical protein
LKIVGDSTCNEVEARSNVYTGAARGYIDDKRFDQMAGELKA